MRSSWNYVAKETSWSPGPSAGIQEVAVTSSQGTLPKLAYTDVSHSYACCCKWCCPMLLPEIYSYWMGNRTVAIDWPRRTFLLQISYEIFINLPVIEGMKYVLFIHCYYSFCIHFIFSDKRNYVSVSICKNVLSRTLFMWSYDNYCCFISSILITSPVLSKVENPGWPNGPSMVDGWVVSVTFGWPVHILWSEMTNKQQNRYVLFLFNQYQFKVQDCWLKFSNHFDVWMAARQQCCPAACHISKLTIKLF